MCQSVRESKRFTFVSMSCGGGWILCDVSVDETRWFGVVERSVATEEAVQDNAQRIIIRTIIDVLRSSIYNDGRIITLFILPVCSV